MHEINPSLPTGSNDNLINVFLYGRHIDITAGQFRI